MSYPNIEGLFYLSVYSAVSSDSINSEGRDEAGLNGPDEASQGGHCSPIT